MPRDQHYRQASTLLANLRGADAADEAKAFSESVEALAKVFEITEAYQDFVFDREKSPNSTGENNPSRASRSAA